MVSKKGRVNGLLTVSRSIGDFYIKLDNPPEKQVVTVIPDVKKFSRQKYNFQFIVMGCDGVWEKISNDEMVKYIRK